MDGIIVKYH